MFLCLPCQSPWFLRPRLHVSTDDRLRVAPPHVAGPNVATAWPRGAGAVPGPGKTVWAPKGALGAWVGSLLVGCFGWVGWFGWFGWVGLVGLFGLFVCFVWGQVSCAWFALCFLFASVATEESDLLASKCFKYLKTLQTQTKTVHQCTLFPWAARQRRPGAPPVVSMASHHSSLERAEKVGKSAKTSRQRR